MHLIASTILSFFLTPVNWIFLMIIAMFVFKDQKRKKYCRNTALGIFFLFSNSWILNSYAKFWQPAKRDVSADAPYSCAVLLGGFGSPDENDIGYFNSSADRFIQAVRLYKLGKIRHILINGGNGKILNKEFNEGEWTKGELKIMGVPDSVILFEDRSANTADNAKNAKIMLDSAQLKPPYLLITSAHHIPRASLLLKKAGVEVVGFPCNYIAGNEKFSWWGIIPNANVLLTWNHYLKETFSYCVYKIK